VPLVLIFGGARNWLLVDRRYAFVSGERASGGLTLHEKSPYIDPLAS
jgi:hypothetical protein